MIFERVNFNDEEIKKMSRDEFESRHINLFGQVYDLITKPAKRTKQKAE